MLKTLIVEDEDFERRALKFLINKYFSKELEIVGEAADGKEALDNALILKPDIILMDINMPIMNGLEASEKIKENNEDVEIIILTAYDYFEYAKQGIKIGVSDYLLKPFSNEDFLNSMTKAIENIKKRRVEIINQRQINENYKKIIPYIEKKVLTEIIYGNEINEESFNSYIKMLDINSNNYCCIVFSGREECSFDESTVIAVKNILSYMFTQIIGCTCFYDMVFLVFDNEVESKILSKKMEDIINRIKSYFKEIKGIEVYSGIGHTSIHIENCYNSYKQAKLILKNKRRSMPCCNKEVYIKNNTIDIYDKENIICAKIINEDLDEALNKFEKLMTNMFNCTDDYDMPKIKENILQMCIKIRKNIFEFIGEDLNCDNEDEIFKNIHNLNNISDINNYINIFIKDLVEVVSGYKNSNNMEVVQEAKRYIEMNYMKEINLDEIANHVSISSYYLSRIFRKSEGINYKDYLTKVRMEKAKQLLIEGKKTIKEISREVGYIDQNYFSRAFKKYSKRSPKEFYFKYHAK